MFTSQLPVHRHLLTRARVKSPLNQISDRWVDQQVFALWRSYMEQHHGFTILSAHNCVWLPHEECERHATLLSHIKFRARVDHLAFESYQPALGTTEIRNRFVAEETKDLVLTRLRDHFEGEETLTDLQVTKGLALSETDSEAPAQLSADYIPPSWSIPRGLAPVRSAMRS